MFWRKLLFLVLSVVMFIVGMPRAQALDWGKPFEGIGKIFENTGKELHDIWNPKYTVKHYKNIKFAYLKKDGVNIKYPVITLANKQVEAQINAAEKPDEAKLQARMTPNRMTSGLKSVSQDCVTTFQDADFVSYTYEYQEVTNPGRQGPWGSSTGGTRAFTMGRVYNLKTGQRVPVSYFLDMGPEDFNRCLVGKIFKVYDSETKKVTATLPALWLPYTPHEYYLVGNGEFFVIYPNNEGDSVSAPDDRYHVLVTPAGIQEYRRLKASGALYNYQVPKRSPFGHD